MLIRHLAEELHARRQQDGADDWNWYLPSWLGWLPKVGREPEPEGART